MVMYAKVLKDELPLEWQANGVEEAIREKEDILSNSNGLEDNNESVAVAKDKVTGWTYNMSIALVFIQYKI